MDRWMNAQLDVWIDGQIDGSMGRCVDRWVDGWIDGQMCGLMGGYVDRWVDGWIMDRLMIDGWMYSLEN